MTKDEIKAAIEVLDRQRRLMRLANRYAYRGHRAGLLSLGYTADQVRELLEPNAIGEVGFSSKQILDVSEKIKRLRKKLPASRRAA